MSSLLTPNYLAFIGLCNEYCSAVENAAEKELSDFVAEMTRILPRIYISALDLPQSDDFGGEIEPAMDEDHYDAVRSSLERLLGAHDTYLEVFEEDMKYSDTPIAASVSESLADLLQVFYNFIATVRDAPEPVILEALEAVRGDFGDYWSNVLCNVMRPLNQIRFNATDLE